MGEALCEIGVGALIEMRFFKNVLRARSCTAWIVACVAALGAAFACSSGGSGSSSGGPANVEQSDAGDGNTNHPWWPILNKHVGVSCAACHTKGFTLGDTPTDCLGCHRKDYEPAQNPQHALNGVDQYPLDCTICHADTGWKLSTWKHASWPLTGRHVIAPCTGCHSGTPPTYKGTPTDCYACHKNDADVVAPSKNPLHTSFPHTCVDCHLMSGWTQGPPLSGRHNEAGFPILTGVHSGPLIACQDCHRLEKGLAAGGANTDCVNCHVSGDHHVSPAIDDYHAKTPDGGSVVAYPQGASTTNFCLQCHTRGQHL
jgi:hypothetical protein